MYVNRFCPLVCLLVVSAFGAETPLETLLKTVEQRYNRSDTLQVVFHDSFTKTGRARRAESGILQLRKPGRMRWEYTDPQGKLAVCDGKIFWTYYPDENRVEKMALRNTEDVRAPLAFLLGKLHFDKEFRNLQGKPEGNDTRITAEPKTDGLPYSAVEFLVTSEGRIREVKVTRFDNSIMGYTFDQEKVGPKLDDKLFQFQVPKGAAVVEADK
jgi:outer membrane lipoprotein carrier protein